MHSYEEETFDCFDCFGIFNGTATEDACGTCDGDGSYCEEHKDCKGNPWTDDASWAELDGCGKCDTDWMNDCEPDCNGVFNGTAQLDACGTCDGDGSYCEEEKDCKGNPWTDEASWAMLDECGTCDTDWTNDCEPDCNGDFKGNALGYRTRVYRFIVCFW